MSGEALKWALDQRVGSPSAQIVLLLLAEQADAIGGLPRIDVHELAAQSQQSARTVFRRLRQFEALGVLSREKTDWLADGSPIVSGKLCLDQNIEKARGEPA